MPTRSSLPLLAATIFVLAMSACGGGSSLGGGGDGGTTLAISALAPSSVAVGTPQTQVTVYGQGFTQQSQVLIDGQPAPSTAFVDSGTLQAQIDISLSATLGTHQLSVKDDGKVSNTLPYTVYAPPEGPYVMQAIPGFLVGENESDAPLILAADVDGDGLADVIMPGPGIQNSGSIAILRGQADGTLAAVQYVSCPTPAALTVGDVDGNGTIDLVSITSLPGSNSITVSILSGDGHGNFQAPVAQQTFTGIDPSQATLADLDGDGRPDLVLGVAKISGVVSNIVWLKNTGGGFGLPATLAILRGYFAIADFDGDGKPDIIYAAPATSNAPQSLRILMNQGSGTFKDKAIAGLNGAFGVPNILDFNLDGIPDLVVEVQQSSGGQLVSFAGNGNGSFTQIASLSTPDMAQLVIGDFDHDGFPDLAGPTGTEPSEIVYFFGDGSGDFVSHVVVGPEGQYAAVGDFNGDGVPDVVVPDRFNFVSLALGRKDRNFPSPLSLSPATMTELSTGDINGDGKPEIFAAGDVVNGIPGTVFLNQGNGSFQYAANTNPSSFLVTDFTGKGVVDLLGGNPNLEIWPNNGTLNFSSSPITFSQPTANIVVADMDGDGHADIVSACDSGQCDGQIFYGDGSYQFTSVTVTNLGSPYVVGDFNGDRKQDIATGYATFLNTGGRTFQEVTTSTLPLTNGALAVVGDFNGDGKDDVAVNLPGDTVISIYYSKGDGTFYQAAQVDPGQYPGVITVGDFNGDGRADLAVGLLLSQQVCMLLNDGKGGFTRSFFASGASAVAMTTADLNGDGKPDLVIGNFVLSFEPANVDVAFHK
jgi:hypothetical protein